MTAEQKLLSILGLCQKAQKLVSGEAACEKALQNGTAALVLLANDASDNTKKKFVNKSFYYKVPCYISFDRDTLSSAIGKSNRATLAVADAGFAGRIEEMLKNIAGADNECGD